MAGWLWPTGSSWLTFDLYYFYNRNIDHMVQCSGPCEDLQERFLFDHNIKDSYASPELFVFY